jgi:hypothetical protein
MYLLSILVISITLAAVWGFRNPKASSRMEKLLLTGLYFWILTFAQLMILAVGYYLNKNGYF